MLVFAPEECIGDRGVHSKEEKMYQRMQNSIALGDVVAAAYDEAATMSSDPREVARIAIEAVARLLRQCTSSIRRVNFLATV
jgi:hypothetical protein